MKDEIKVSSDGAYSLGSLMAYYVAADTEIFDRENDDKDYKEQFTQGLIDGFNNYIEHSKKNPVAAKKAAKTLIKMAVKGDF